MRRTFIWGRTRLIAPGLDECAGIDETASNDAVERGNNSGVGDERLQFVNVGLGFEVFALSDIDVLARSSRPAAINRVPLQMKVRRILWGRRRRS